MGSWAAPNTVRVRTYRQKVHSCESHPGRRDILKSRPLCHTLGSASEAF